MQADMHEFLVSRFDLFTAEFRITALNLAEHIPQTFTSLKELNLDVRAFQWASPPSNMNTVMSELFASIANSNVLEKLSITIHGELFGPELPSQEPWSQVASLLASPSAFSCLSVVEVNLRFRIAYRRFWRFEKEFKDRQQELDQFIIIAMNELTDREGMMLRGCLSAHRYE